MSFGSSDWQPWILNEEESLPLLKHAYDCGINTWDAVSRSIYYHSNNRAQFPRSSPPSLNPAKSYPQPRARTEEISTAQLTTHQGRRLLKRPHRANNPICTIDLQNPPSPHRAPLKMLFRRFRRPIHPAPNKRYVFQLRGVRQPRRTVQKAHFRCRGGFGREVRHLYRCLTDSSIGQGYPAERDYESFK